MLLYLGRTTFPKMRKESRSESIGISVGALQAENRPRQLSLFVNERQRERQMLADRMVSAIRSRYGYFAVQRGIMYEDKYLSSLNASAETEAVVRPY
jgi:DNA polymerase IV